MSRELTDTPTITWDGTDVTRAKANAVVLRGDTGTGGAAGIIPAPAAGDAAAGKVLTAGGLWAYPNGVKLPFLAPIVYAGDSITAMAFISDGSGYQSNMRGFMTWAQALSGNIAYAGVSANAGTTGDTSTMLLARYATDVVAKSPKIVVLLIGTNDMLSATAGNQAAVIATYTNNLVAMIAANRGIGAHTILGKIIPNGTVGAPMTAAQLATWIAINAAIAARAASDVTVVDFEPLIGARDANHTGVTGCYKADAIHPSIRGSFFMGGAVARVIKALVAPGDYISAKQTDPSKIFHMSGNGTLADGLATSLSATITVASSVIPRQDGLGQQQKLTFTGASPVSADHAGVVFLAVPYTGVFVAGDTVQAIIELECVDAAGFGTFGIWAQDASTEAIGTIAYDALSDLPNMPWTGIFASPPKVLANSWGNANVFAVGYIGVATTVSGSFKVGRMTLVKV